jgi:hypothetical protein
MRQRQRGIALGDIPIEHRGQMFQVFGRGIDRRDVRDLVGRAPGKDRCSPVRRAVRQPRLRRGDQPYRILGAAPPGELAGDEPRMLVPREGEAPAGKIELARRIEKRRQQRARGDLAGVHELRDVLDADPRRVAGGGIHPAEGAVGGAEVDADDEAVGYRCDRGNAFSQLRLPQGRSRRAR